MTVTQFKDIMTYGDIFVTDKLCVSFARNECTQGGDIPPYVHTVISETSRWGFQFFNSERLAIKMRLSSLISVRNEFLFYIKHREVL